MDLKGFAWTGTVLLVMVVFMAGCVTSSEPAATTVATPVAAITTASEFPVTTVTAKTAEIDTTINVHFNDLACLNVQEETGKDYLYPDQTFTLYAASPGVAGVNVNVLFVDENDQLALRQITPKWDAIQKKWLYEGIVPLAQFNDVTTPVEKTLTIKKQSKYYICVDDRKETGINDVILRVPVKLKRIP
ncbi:MAG: hypothetical protein M0Q92_05010 [Methanoregula sp.]|jgi:hypothetical protein|nr:hypothetical protein [Methanoregula sp.]